MSNFEPAMTQSVDDIAELEFFEKLKMIPMEGLMRRIEEELEDPVFTSNAMPKGLRITYL